MGRDPDAKHHDIDGRDNPSCNPFDFYDETPVFSNNIDSIDDDLHEQLNFEHPEEQQEE